MLNNKIYFAFLLFFTTQIISSQEVNEPNLIKSHYLLTNISSITPYYGSNPRATLGYLMQPQDRWMYGIELGYASYSFLGSDSRNRKGIDKGYKLFEVRPSIHYILNPRGNAKPYVAAEFFYINHKDVFINDEESLRNKRYINNGDDNPTIAYDKADFLRQKYGVNLNFGVFLNIFRRFGVNCNIGLGIRNRNIEYSNLINPSEINRSDSESFITPIHLLETGNKLGANVSLSFKLFYKL